MARCIVVLVTCPTQRSAGRLADLLVKGRLAACVNIVPRIRSVYRWKGSLERAGEILLIIKTTSTRLPALQRAVLAHHPYDSPEIIALPITAGREAYLDWARDSVA